MAAYVALLRGINVGGKLIRMDELRDCVAGLGYEGVRTYIASGNVLFRSPQRSGAKLYAELERAIEERFGLPVRVVVRSAGEVRKIAEAVPADWVGAKGLRVMVAFVMRGVDARALAARLTPREGIDELVAAPGAVIWATRRDALSRSGLTKVVGTPRYKELTTRGLNTTLKLDELLRTRA